MSTDLTQFRMREATAADDGALFRLARLAGGLAPSGRNLVGELDGEIVAAVPIAGGSAIADPGRSTSAMISLLGLRAAQWRGLADRSKSGERERVERQPLRRAA